MIVFIKDTINGSISLIANSPLRQVIQYISHNIIPINISSITILGWLYVKYVRNAKLSAINIDKRIIFFLVENLPPKNNRKNPTK